MSTRRWLLGAAVGTTAVFAVTGAVLAETSGSAGLSQTAIRDQQTLGVNNWGLEITNYGSFGFDIAGSDAGGEFPRGSGWNILFAAGFQFGTQVVVDGDTIPAVSQVEFDSEFQPGAILDGPGPVDELTADDSGSADNAVLMATKGADLPLGWPDGLDIAGDGATYSVFNDLDTLLSFDTPQTPLGIEVSQHSFAFAKQGAQGDIVYLRFTLSNKSDQDYENSYAEVWFDPDNGSASNDLTGCDIETSLGYTYNSTEENRNTAFGADFFQGPIVDADDSLSVIERGSVTFNKDDDYEYVTGDVEISGKQVLGMSAFSYYINGTDPVTDEERYNLMQGLQKLGGERPNGPFDFAGDPVEGTGDIDGGPADKRMALITGPFTLASGESQDVVVAIIGAEAGNSTDPLDAISVLRATDEEAQIAYNYNFVQQSSPPPPVTQAVAYSGEVILTWDRSAESAYDEYGDLLGLGEVRSDTLGSQEVVVDYDSLTGDPILDTVYEIETSGYDDYDFQGYRVYRSMTGESTDWDLMAEYDVIDGVTEVRTRVFNNTLQEYEVDQLHIGDDTGLSYFFVDAGLTNGTAYYYAVSSYDYQPAEFLERTLESPQGLNSFRLVPSSAAAGYDYSDASVPADSMIAHEGLSDGSVTVTMIDPSRITGDDYMVTFRDHEKVTIEGDTVTVGVWDLINETTGDTVLVAQENQSGDAAYEVAEGILVKVMGAVKGWKLNAKGNPMLDEIVAAGAPVDPDGYGGPGNDVFHSLNSTAQYYLSAGGGDGGVERFDRQNGANLTSNDIYMRWDNDPNNWGWWVYDDPEDGSLGYVSNIPFGVYEVDPVTEEETQLMVWLYSGGGTPGVLDMSEATADAYFGFPASDWCYAYPGDYDAFAADCADGVINTSDWNPGGWTLEAYYQEKFSRLIFCDYEGLGNLVADGTEIKFSTTKPNTSADVFSFSTGAGRGFDASAGAEDLDDIRVVPNPYYAYSEYDNDQFDRRVKFMGLPAACTIRIFNVSGTLVRTIEHSDSSNNDRSETGEGESEAASTSIEHWDLKNESGIWAGSGVYIAHIESSVGTTFVKFAIIQGSEQIGIF